MVQPNWYYNLQSKEPESPLGYLVQCLLESRMRLGYPSTEVTEELVNVYLGHLLVEVMTSAYGEQHLRYVATRETDVFHRVEDIRDAHEKFLVYRANADHRLLATSVFCPEPVDAAGKQVTASRQAEGRTYYHFAAEYNKQLYRKATSLSEILERLAAAFETYGLILTHMRHAYFCLWPSLSKEHLQAQVRTWEQREPSEREALLNTFLDAYRAWQTQGLASDHAHLMELAQRLARIDPEFRFDQLPLP